MQKEKFFSLASRPSNEPKYNGMSIIMVISVEDKKRIESQAYETIFVDEFADTLVEGG